MLTNKETILWNEYIFVAPLQTRNIGSIRTSKKLSMFFLFRERIHKEIMGLDSHSADFEG